MRIFLLVVSASLGCAHASSPKQEPAPIKQQAAAEKSDVLRGVVAETFDSGGYTYMRVILDDGREIWAAAQTAAMNKDARVVLRTSVQMHNFEAKSLGRVFEVIYFVHIESSDVVGDFI